MVFSVALLTLAPNSSAIQFNTAQLLQHMLKSFGPNGQSILQSWFDLLAKEQQATQHKQLIAVNQFWNQAVMATSDATAWGQVDYWATPLESLGRRAGDCEDYVIGKYFSLLRLGVAEHKLRLIYVRARIGGMYSTDSVAHMVLGYYDSPGAEPLILDNLLSDILPSGQRPDLTPVFSFNGQGIYVQGAKPTPTSRITRWRDLLSRMQQEGFQP